MSDQFMIRSEIINLILRLTIFSGVTYFSIKWMLNQIDPTSKMKKSAKKKAEEQLQRLGIDNLKDPLTEYEMMIASHLVNPSDIPVTWSDVAGLEHITQELRESIILPIQKKRLFQDSQLCQPPKGVLLHGPPGCGKTLIAKATAREAGMRFINLDVSILTDKWYGESQKLACAVFSLAAKIQPCIIFIDEIDSFLRVRNSQDHEVTAMMKAQFMSMWDGLCTDPDSCIVVMGATNRPQDLDRAILRRMPATFHIGMPNLQQRQKILELVLANEPTADVDLQEIARLAENFSGSDLRELCRTASVYRVREYMNLDPALLDAQGAALVSDSDEEFQDALRPIIMDDILISLKKMRNSKVHTGSLFMQPRLDMD